jgi:hypothetical protein
VILWFVRIAANTNIFCLDLRTLLATKSHHTKLHMQCFLFVYKPLTIADTNKLRFFYAPLTPFLAVRSTFCFSNSFWVLIKSDHRLKILLGQVSSMFSFSFLQYYMSSRILASYSFYPDIVQEFLTWSDQSSGHSFLLIVFLQATVKRELKFSKKRKRIKSILLSLTNNLLVSLI